MNAGRAWPWRRAVRRLVAVVTAPAALAALEARAAALEIQVADLGCRVERLAAVSQAREKDDRAWHDGDVAELLGSLLELNEALHRPRAGHAALAPAGGEEVDP